MTVACKNVDDRFLFVANHSGRMSLYHIAVNENCQSVEFTHVPWLDSESIPFHCESTSDSRSIWSISSLVTGSSVLVWIYCLFFFFVFSSGEGESM